MTQLSTDCQEQPQSPADMLAWAEDQAWTIKTLATNLKSALAHDCEEGMVQDYDPLCDIICKQVHDLAQAIDAIRSKINS